MTSHILKKVLKSLKENLTKDLLEIYKHLFKTLSILSFCVFC